MFFYEGQSCPVCGKAFMEGEDVVSCPQCGAPHHRSCWRQEGHCHFADAHGTPQQWSREQAQAQAAVKKCPQCGYENPEFAEFCSHCGRPIEATDWTASQPPPNDRRSTPPPGPNPYGPGSYGWGYGPGSGGPMPGYGEYAPFRTQGLDPLGGVPKDEKIDDVDVEDLAAAVGQNTVYYLPRFYKMDRGASRRSWNWSAFLLTPYWLLYRKNYLCGALMLAFTLIQTFIVNYILYVTLPVDTTSYYSLFQALQTMIGNPNQAMYFWMLFGISMLDLALRVAIGFLGNSLYMGTCVNRVKRLQRDNPDDYKVQLPTAGGVSFALGMLAYFAGQMVSMFVYML